jgi:hypothetical protein
MQIRVQRERRPGYKTPPNTKYVGRPGKWGNPYRVEDHGPEKAVELYRDHVRGREAEIMAELGGRNLSCFCKLSNPCHADVLLEIANGQTEPDAHHAHKESK